MIKYIVLDLETGGLDAKKNPIVQIAAQVYQGGVLLSEFDEKMKPLDWQILDPMALKVNGSTAEELDKCPEQGVIFNKFISWMDNHIDRYNSLDKFYQVGYNIHSFDAQFLRTWFNINSHKYYGSYFYNPPIDVMLVAMFTCIGQRHLLPNFKLLTVCKSLGIEIDESKLHEAMYDTKKTAELFFLLEKELLPNGK